MMFKQLYRLQIYTFYTNFQMFSTLFYTNFHCMHTLFYTNFHRILAFFTRTFHRITFMTTAFLVLFIIIESLHILPQFLVERMLGHRVFIAEDDELHAGSRHCHVHSAQIL